MLNSIYPARLSMLGMASLLVFATPVVAQAPGWDRVAHIRSVSAALAPVVRAKGAFAVNKTIEVCYQQQDKQKAFTKDVERCVIQDIVHATVSAQVYAMHSKSQAGEVAAAMVQRVTKALASRGVAVDEARSFVQLVKQEGLRSYVQAM